MTDATTHAITGPNGHQDPDAIEAAVQGFAERYHAAPDGVWSAPGRVNLIGEHTDYNDGYVLPFAIDRRAAAAVRLRSDRFVEVMSSASSDRITIALDDITPEAVDGWSAYPLGVAWALTGPEDRHRLPGVEIFIDSRVPIGAGLSSSAALGSATAMALNELWARGNTRTGLALAVQRAENTVVGAPTGIMDPSASLLGEVDCAVFLDCRDQSAQLVPLRFADAALTLLVIDTKQRHAHSVGGYAERRASCELAATQLGVNTLRDIGLGDLSRAATILDDETLRRVRHVVTENDRVLQTVATLATAGPAAIGPLLSASHGSMRDDFEISTPALDLAVNAACQAGAIGARMTGGGFGGSAIALVRTTDLTAVTEAVIEAFAEVGFDEPDLSTVIPSPGARRDR